MREQLSIVAVGFDRLLTDDTSDLTEVRIERMLRFLMPSILRGLHLREEADIPMTVSVEYDVSATPGVRVKLPHGSVGGHHASRGGTAAA